MKLRIQLNYTKSQDKIQMIYGKNVKKIKFMEYVEHVKQEIEEY